MVPAAATRLLEAVDRAFERLPGRADREFVFSGPAARRAAALTFDDGPSPANTPRVLDLLARERARATFFVVGECVEGREEILRRAVAEGHELANHTYSHPHTIVLMHDGGDRRPATLKAVESLVPRLREAGIELVTVSELLAPAAPAHPAVRPASPSS